MIVLNYEDQSVSVTRGDAASFPIQVLDGGEIRKFSPGEVVRISVYGKKDAQQVYLRKDFAVTEETDTVQISLTKQDTKFGDVISKPTVYWYEVELNPDTDPKTVIGYDEDGPKIFQLLPEGGEVTA